MRIKTPPKEAAILDLELRARKLFIRADTRTENGDYEGAGALREAASALMLAAYYFSVPKKKSISSIPPGSVPAFVDRASAEPLPAPKQQTPRPWIGRRVWDSLWC